jgi:hypothetical protein
MNKTSYNMNKENKKGNYSPGDLKYSKNLKFLCSVMMHITQHNLCSTFISSLLLLIDVWNLLSITEF